MLITSKTDPNKIDKVLEQINYLNVNSLHQFEEISLEDRKDLESFVIAAIAKFSQKLSHKEIHKLWSENNVRMGLLCYNCNDCETTIVCKPDFSCSELNFNFYYKNKLPIKINIDDVNCKNHYLSCNEVLIKNLLE